MADDHDDLDLRELFASVDSVQPADRLGEIRARTTGRSRRPWGYALAAAGAVAATVAVVSVTTRSPDVTPPSADRPTLPVDRETPSSTEVLVPVYAIGDTDRGPRLFREFREIAQDEFLGDTLRMGAAELSRAPDDPDYRTPWPADAVLAASRDDTGSTGTIRVVVADTTRDRGDGVSAEEAELGVQQLVLTLQAVTQDQLSVTLVSAEGEPVDRLLGVAVDGPLTAARQNDVLALVSISDPAEGADVGEVLVARGRANSPEGTVPWQVLDADGVERLSGFATADGSIDRLHPWRTRIPLGDLGPGTYTFRATTTDLSEGEGFAPDADTRTFVVR